MPPNRTSEPHAGRVALVTGAARGIGQAIAAGLAERGTRIVLGDIGDVSEASDLIGATGHPAVPVTPDVSDPPSTEAARDRVTDALGRAGIAAINRKHHPQNLFHHNVNIQPAQAGGRPDNTSDISRLGNHPITPALLATDLAAAREFYLGKLGQQIDRKDENAIGFRYGNGTRLDVTQSTVGTADQQTQAAWQVSDIRAEVAELRARGNQGRRLRHPRAKDRRRHRRHRLRLGRLDHRPSHERPQPQPDSCHLTWPELRPGGLRGRRLRCCGSLPGGSPRSCQGHLL
jgi:catechol 2,3-dioxygenase-like lactoylglutathione lyase family enzyme